MKNFLTLFLTLFVASSVWAFEVDGITYLQREDAKVSLMVAKGISGKFTIPSTVDYRGVTYSVIGVDDDAFNDCVGLTSITIPENITFIYDDFSNCTNLTEININAISCVIGDEGGYIIASNASTLNIGDKVEELHFYNEIPNLTSISIESEVDFSEGYLYFTQNGIRYRVLNKYSVEVSSNGYYENGLRWVSRYLGEIVIPSSVTAGNTFVVVGIEEGAFWGSNEMSSVTIPDGVTSIGRSAFNNCTSLTSVTIPESVTSIGEYAFYNCTSLTEVINKSSLTINRGADENGEIGRYAKYIFNGNKIVINDCAFSERDKKLVRYVGNDGCLSLPENFQGDSYIINYNAFYEYNNFSSISIPNGIDVSNANLYFTKDGFRYHVLNNNSVKIAENSYSGDIVIPTSVTAGNTFAVVGVESNAFYNYNPEAEVITSITINSDIDVSDAGLYFTKDGILYHVLSKNSVVVSNGGYYVTNYLGDVVIPSSVTAGNTFIIVGIEEGAFRGSKEMSSVTIPESVTRIGENAFSGCTKLTKVTCLATTPPEAATNSFENYNGYLYIPCEGKDDYDIDACWGSFKHVECIGAETVELPKDEVKVEPEKTEAVFSMPTNESAFTYTLTIQNNGVTFCTLTFNAQGQLVNIDFSINKSYDLKAGVSGYQFTVTGLSEATDYGYSFKALASNKSVLKEYTGSFTTKNGDGTGGSSQGGTSTAINSVSNATTVAIVNNQILVNGEAPAFVYTISGQKIANKNLKSGVYFVSVEGETVKVSVQ